MTDVKKLKRKPLKVEAIEFTGTNGKEIVEYVKSKVDKENLLVKNGGRYVTIHIYQYGVRLRKGDWLVIDADQIPKAYREEELSLFFTGA